MVKIVRKIYPFYIIVDFLLMALSLYACYLFRYNNLDDILSFKLFLPDFKGHNLVFISWIIFVIWFLVRRGLYYTNRGLTISKEIAKVTTCVLYGSILVCAIIFLGQYKFFSRLIFVESFFLFCFLLSFWRVIKRIILRKLITEGFHNVNVLIVGNNRTARVVLKEIEKFPWWGFRVVGFVDNNETRQEVDGLPVLGKTEDFVEIARKYFVDEVIITIPFNTQAIANLMSQAQRMYLGLHVVPYNFEESVAVLDVDFLGVVPLLTYKTRMHHPADFALKRLFDILFSLVLIVFLSPIFILISIIIKIDSKGPVLYVQKRTGYKGRIFDFYKFRSMVKDADKKKESLMTKNEVKDGVIFKIKSDPRITKVGKFLRRYSLDELPQLFNVFKGDMSLVGPRPFPVEESKKFNYYHIQRLSIRPGITGLSQVRGRSDLTFHRWVKWDIWYVNNWSFWLDMNILLWTIPAVFRGKGAY